MANCYMTVDELAKLRRSLLTRKFSDDRPTTCKIEKWENAGAEGRGRGSQEINHVTKTGLCIHELLAAY